jgi:P22 coat protein - gene protein 5
MASTLDFRPEVWAAELLQALRKRYVYASAGVVNRDYEGEIAQAGDTVRINTIARPTIRDYTEHGTITWEQLSDIDRALVIDQADYFAFKVDDIEKRQMMGGFVETASDEASVGMVEETDEYISLVMTTAVDGTANDVGPVQVDISSETGWAQIVALRSKLNLANVPPDGRWLIIPDALSVALLQDNRFLDASRSGSTETLRAGEIGRAAGFTVYESNTVPQLVGPPVRHRVLAGHAMATTFAEQINETESIRLENQFGDGVRGLHLYGAKVVRPEALALADIEVIA